MHIHILSTPGFGNALANELSTRFQTEAQDLQSAGDPSRWPKAQVQIVATDREEPWAFDICDMTSFILQRPWMPIVLEPHTLRVGPLISPPNACYRCYLRRLRQSGRRSEIDQEMEDTGLQPRTLGYLATQVKQAAILAMRLLSQSDPDDVNAPDLYRMGLLETRLTHGKVTPVDDCGRCTSPRSYRDTADLFQVLNNKPSNVKHA